MCPSVSGTWSVILSEELSTGGLRRRLQGIVTTVTTGIVTGLIITVMTMTSTARRTVSGGIGTWILYLVYDITTSYKINNGKIINH